MTLAHEPMSGSSFTEWINSIIDSTLGSNSVTPFWYSHLIGLYLVNEWSISASPFESAVMDNNSDIESDIRQANSERDDKLKDAFESFLKTDQSQNARQDLVSATSDAINEALGKFNGIFDATMEGSVAEMLNSDIPAPPTLLSYRTNKPPALWETNAEGSLQFVANYLPENENDFSDLANYAIEYLKGMKLKITSKIGNTDKFYAREIDTFVCQGNVTIKIGK